PPTALVERILSEVRERSGAVPGVIHASVDGARGVAVDIPDDEPTLLIVFGFRDTVPDTLLLPHIGTALAVLLVQQGLRREHERRTGAELLSHLIDNRLDDDTAYSRLSAAHIDVSQSSVVAVISDQENALENLHIALYRHGVHHLLLRPAEAFFIVL